MDETMVQYDGYKCSIYIYPMHVAIVLSIVVIQPLTFIACSSVPKIWSSFFSPQLKEKVCTLPYTDACRGKKIGSATWRVVSLGRCGWLVGWWMAWVWFAVGEGVLPCPALPWPDPTRRHHTKAFLHTPPVYMSVFYYYVEYIYREGDVLVWKV